MQSFIMSKQVYCIFKILMIHTIKTTWTEMTQEG